MGHRGNRLACGLSVALSVAACAGPNDSVAKVEERIRWSKSEMRDYEAGCHAKQPRGVKAEEADYFCKCKTVGLAIIFPTPQAAEAALPADAERALYQETGKVPARQGPDEYAQVVDMCKKAMRKKYGVPEVSLEEF